MGTSFKPDGLLVMMNAAAHHFNVDQREVSDRFHQICIRYGQDGKMRPLQKEILKMAIVGCALLPKTESLESLDEAIVKMGTEYEKIKAAAMTTYKNSNNGRSKNQ